MNRTQVADLLELLYREAGLAVVVGLFAPRAADRHDLLRAEEKLALEPLE